MYVVVWVLDGMGQVWFSDVWYVVGFGYVVVVCRWVGQGVNQFLFFIGQRCETDDNEVDAIDKDLNESNDEKDEDDDN